MVLMLLVLVFSWAGVMYDIKAKKGRSTPGAAARDSGTTCLLSLTFVLETVVVWVLFWQLLDDTKLALIGAGASMAFGMGVWVKNTNQYDKAGAQNRWRTNVVANQDLFFLHFANLIGAVNAYVLIEWIEPRDKTLITLAFFWGSMVVAYIVHLVAHELFAQIYCE